MSAIDTPIYDELAERHGIHIPDPFESDPIAALAAGVEQSQWLPVVRATPWPRADTETRALPVVHAVDPDQMPPETGEHGHGEDNEAAA